MTIQFEVVKGAQIKLIEQSFADLRMTIFREYPYLYAGDLLTEKKYFEMFSENTIFGIKKASKKWKALLNKTSGKRSEMKIYLSIQ